MNRTQLLAAETYHYSYANYADHLGIGNIRFDRLMPDTVKALEKAAAEGWPLEKLAKELGHEPAAAADLMGSFKQAKQIVDAGNPAESFRTGVRFSIRYAVAQGLKDEQAVERLVTQICYRAADLAYLLKQEGTTLSRYSRYLRREPDTEYYEGYFDEEE
jgi:hypothetical protein